MVTVSIDVGNGIKKLQRFGVRLPREQNRAIMKVGREFAEFVQKSAKIRAPKFSGQLAESIKVDPPKKNQISVTVNSPYAAAQEYGFIRHDVFGFMHSKAGYRFVDWMRAKGFQGSQGKLISSRFSVEKPFKKSGYFLGPAIESGLNRLPEMLNKKINEAIRRSIR